MSLGRVAVLGITTGLGRRLTEILLYNGITPVGVVRAAHQVEPLQAAGVRPVLLDTTADVGSVLYQGLLGADAVVLVAGTGSGPGSLGAATRAASPAALLTCAAQRAGVRRYVMVSALLPGADDRAALGERLPDYLREKTDAELAVRDSGLDWCVVRPGELTDAVATGRITAWPGTAPVPRGEIGRTDVASVIWTVLTEPGLGGVVTVTSGDTPIAEALRSAGTVGTRGNTEALPGMDHGQGFGT